MSKTGSILLRPTRTSSAKNLETAEEQFAAEQARQKQLAEQRRQLEEEKVRARNGDPVARAAIQERTRREMEEQLKLRQVVKSQEAAVTDDHAYTVRAVNEAARDIEAEQEAARREYQRYLMEENKRLADAREQARKEQREREIAEARAAQDFYQKNFGRSLR